MRNWIGILTGLLLLGCQTASQQAAVDDPPPANYRQIAAEHVRTAFFDPYSVRDAAIAAPKRAAGPSLNLDGGFYTPWVVCVRANAKNRFGAYTGAQQTALAIKGDQIVNSWDETKFSGTVCAGSQYQPFPEVESAAGTPGRATR